MRATTYLALLRGSLDGLLVAALCLAFVGPVVARGLPILGHETIVITGASMEPAIPIGSVVVLSRVAPDAIRQGDVVSIRQPERNVTFTHRVVEVVQRDDGPWLRTRGDNSSADDPVMVPAAWALGRVDARIPGAGYLLRMLALPSGVAAMLGLGLTLYLAARLVEDAEYLVARRRRVLPPIRVMGPVPSWHR